MHVYFLLVCLQTCAFGCLRLQVLAHTHLYLLISATYFFRTCECLAERDARSQGVAFKLCVLDVQCNVPPQVDEIECIIPAYKGLALK